MLVLTLASQAVFPPSKHKSGVFSWYTVLASFCHTSRMQLSYQHETRTDMLLCSLPSSSISDPERALYLVLMVLRDFKANSNLAELVTTNTSWESKFLHQDSLQSLLCYLADCNPDTWQQHNFFESTSLLLTHWLFPIRITSRSGMWVEFSIYTVIDKNTGSYFWWY